MKATVKGLLALNSLRGRTTVGVLAVLLIGCLCAVTQSEPTRIVPAATPNPLAQDTYGRLPLSFIKNEGQLGDAVKFYERGLGHSIFFADTEISFQFETRADRSAAGLGDDSRHLLKEGRKTRLGTDSRKISHVRLYPVHMQTGAGIEGLDRQEGKVNYFIGSDATRWKTNLATYRSVVYREVYPGVDLKFYGSNEQLEYDVIVKAGADPSQVKFGYSGIESLNISDNGDLHLLLPDGGTLIHKKPVAYQEIEGQRLDIEGTFSIEPLPPHQESAGEREEFVFGFKVAAYNPAYPLIIDPVLVYSTYLGGAGNDTGHAVAVDASGYAYVTGRTYSSTFPTASSLDSSYGGNADAFVTKLNPAGTALVYSTYLGGSDFDSANNIAVDSSGNAYVTGETTSTDFPTYNAYSSALHSQGSSDAFVVKLNASGSALGYATYLGGSSYDVGLGIAVDSSGVAYVSGETASTDFPTVSAFQSTYGGGDTDAFVTRFSASGTSLSFSTYAGGSSADSGYGIAVDSSNIYVTGETASANFPISGNMQYTYGGGDSDAFVVKIARSSLAKVYATYLGGSGSDYGSGIAVGSDGSVYVTGTTSSTDFPLSKAAQGTPGGGEDAFVTKLASDGNSFSFSTYLGGVGNDNGYAIAVDGKDNAYVTGKTSGSFPTIKAIQTLFGGGGSDGFLARIDCTESVIAYSTYLGGAAVDVGRGIAVGTGGNVYVTGWSSSYNFPTTSGAFMVTNAGGYDAFVTKINALLADFSATPTSGTYPLTVAFTDTSEGAVSTRLWNFGDGATTTIQTPSHTYSSAGTYTVSLTVTGPGGEDTKTRSGYIKVSVPEVTIAATTPRVLETGGGNGQFTVTRSAYTSEALVVNFTVGGSATAGTDYSALGGSVTIPKGSSSATLSVVPTADDFNDGNETVVVTLAASPLYTIGTGKSAAVTIVDRDLPKVTVSASVPSVSEKSNQKGLFVVSRAGITTNPLTVKYTVSGTAVNTDYTALSGSVTIPANASSISIEVSPLWDQVYDGDKTVILTLSSNNLYTVATPSSATVTILDSDLPMVTITAATPTIAENASQPAQFIVTHTGTTALPLTVQYTVGGTAVSGANYQALPLSVTIPQNSASAPITLTPIQDGNFTGDLTVVVSLASSTLYTIGAPNAATITILEKDLPTVTVTATQPNAKEASVTGQFTVSRTGNTSADLTVGYAVGGTATPGVNYTALPGSIVIPKGASSKTLTVQPLDDSLYTGPTTVILILGDSTLYRKGTADTATVTIADNDVPTVTIAATVPAVAETSTGKGQFTVTRSDHTNTDLIVTYTISGTASTVTDYFALSGTVHILPGNSSAVIAVNPKEDFVSDGDKTVVVTITGSDWYKVGSPSSDTVTVLDSDLPTINITTTVARVLEKGSQSAQFSVTRDGSSASALTVRYTTGGTAVSGVNYVAPSGSVIIPAGSSSNTIEISPRWDHTYDGNQTLEVTLAGDSQYNVGSSYRATAVIVEQDVPTVTITASVPTAEESASARGRFLVARSDNTIFPLPINYMVSGTAVDSVDYTHLPGTVTIPAGSSSAVIEVAPKEDSVPDDAETVIITLSDSTLYSVGSPNTATVTIYEKGPATVSIEASVPIAQEGGTAGQFTVYRTKMTTEALTVPYSIGGTAVPGQHYTALQGSVTIPVGSSSNTISVQAIDNGVYEGPTSVVVTLLPSANYDLGAAGASVMIADNDGAEIQMEAIVSKKVAYEEGQVAAQAKVYRPGGNTAGAIPVAYSIGGTATNGEDYQTLSGTVVIPDGSASALIDIIPIDDSLDEPTETVLLTLIDNGWYTIGWKSSATISIVDNDVPTVSVTAIDDNASERGGANGIFRVTRQGVATSALNVFYSVGGTAKNGSRYGWLSGQLTIDPGSSFADIPVIPNDDKDYQGNETVTLTILSTDVYKASSPNTATIIIYDDDNATVTITAPVGTANENSTDPGVFRVSRNGNAAVSPPLELSYSVSGTAVYGVDYDASFTGTGKVVIPAGAASADIEIFPINNETLEGTRSVILTLAPGSLYHIGASSSAVVSIVDDEMPAVSVVALDALASENATNAGTFTFSRSGDPADPMEVHFTVGGTAVPDTDYMALPTSVTIPGGASSVNLTVSGLQNQTAQLDKTVIVTLASDASYYAGSPNKATVTIVDDDTPLVSITAQRNATETGTKGQFKFSRVGNIHVPLTVQFTTGGTAVPGTNYKTLPRRISFAKDQASKILAVTPIDDNKTTGDLTVELTLSQTANYLLGSSKSASISITDSDLPQVSVVATDAYAVEQGLQKGIFTITRTRSTNSALTVKCSFSGTAKAGTDYKSLPTTVIIPKGAASKVVTVTPIDDSKTDTYRTLQLAIDANPAYLVGKPSAAEVYISDTGLPQVSITATDKLAALPSDTGKFSIYRIGPTTDALQVKYTVSGTAKNGTDYNKLTGKATIPKNKTSTTVTVTPLADGTVQTNETVTLTLVKPTDGTFTLGPPKKATVTILGSDLPVINVVAKNPNASEKGPTAGTFTISRTGETISAETVAFTLTGTATKGKDYVSIGGSVDIPRGASFVEVTIMPKTDTLKEANETVILTVTPTVRYLVGPSKSATITIANK